MILLALSIVGAILVSNWLTSPLRMIQRSFSSMELGKNNQAIDYQSNDELGDLVREYNQKLVDLETAAVQLAQSERESAWREMAKQVAHEIKNPLTPMKLSIQQLQRVFDPNDPQSKQKIDRVAQSIIEQIDALTSIANAFANFAKMPQPIVEKLEFRTFLESIVAVFESQESCKVSLTAVQEAIYVEGDKEMLLRVINNLITNGIQAIPNDRKGNVSILLTADDVAVSVTITDNGCGIPEEQLSTIFEPYFTTKSTGTGLGLAMVKQIVEGHYGTIEVKQTSEAGTTMVLQFPRVS
jgi:nitrogen fixation/metabolism regulation signal transduction histidine kinase